MSQRNGTGRLVDASPYVSTLRELATALHVSGSTVKNLRRDGLRVSNRGYHLEEARRLLTIRSLRAKDLASQPDALKFKTEKLHLEVRQKRLELQIMQGEWVRKETVIREWTMRAIEIKNAFKGLGRSLAPQLVQRGPAEICALIDQKVYEILRGLARGKQTIDNSTTLQQHNVEEKEGYTHASNR